MDDYQRYQMNEPSGNGGNSGGGNGCSFIIGVIVFAILWYALGGK
ncbi:MAG: hypothetical protein RSD35_00545 [Oscillospiraceae bacterium]